MCRADPIVLRSNNGELKTIRFNNKQVPGPCITVLDLKLRAVKEFPKSGPSESKLRLVVVDKPLDNDTTPSASAGSSLGLLFRWCARLMEADGQQTVTSNPSGRFILIKHIPL